MKKYFSLSRCTRLGATAVAIATISLFNTTAVQATGNSQPVTVHQHVNFRGRSLSVGEGDVSISDLRSSVGNDIISSITIEPGYNVLACQNSRLRGRCDTFTGDVADLRTIDFNDVISSLRISKSADLSPVTVYRNVGFRGSSLDIQQEGVTTLGDLRRSGPGNDVISSIRVTEGYEVEACEHGGGRGRCELFTSSISDLRSIQFNDIISYLSVTRISGAGFELGDIGPAGGFVFYLESGSNGTIGLEAAPADVVSSEGLGPNDNEFVYGCFDIVTNAFLSDIGDGRANTDTILAAGCLEQGIAAVAANEYVSPDGTSDWFLPSIDELAAMRESLFFEGIGGFSDEIPYWSSTEIINFGESELAFQIEFDDQFINSTERNFRQGAKSASSLVRPARAFNLSAN